VAASETIDAWMCANLLMLPYCPCARVNDWLTRCLIMIPRAVAPTSDEFKICANHSTTNRENNAVAPTRSGLHL
jgi:hypothetical protein